jgi:uncharacterized membrane-anchored protein
MPAPEDHGAAYREHVLKVLDGARYREGSQQLPGGMARLELPEGYRYLDAEDARKVVVDLWGNPPAAAGNLLGLVIPAGEHLASPASWSLVLSFHEDGRVDDHDITGLDPADLAARLHAASAAANRTRRQAGFEALEFSDWAVPPAYDADQRVLSWTKRFSVSGQPEDTLNHEVRVLGRRGMLAINGIAGIGRAADIAAAAPAIVAMVRFNEGHRYADFDPATDRRAAYPLAGLVLGGVPAPAAAPPAGSVAYPIAAALLLGLGSAALLRHRMTRKAAA